MDNYRARGEINMLELTCGVLVSLGVYLILGDHLVRSVFGIVILSTAINIILLISGRLHHTLPAYIGSAAPYNFSNPLPQALILTAIVIGFGILAFLCALVKTLLNHNLKSKQR